MPARFAEIGDPGAGIDDAVGSLDALLELSRKHEAEGEGDAPWPPNYAKQAGEPPRVQPSRKRRPDSEYEQGRGESGGPPPEVAAERAAAVAAGDPNAGLPTEWEGSRPTPTGRRKTNIPVIEISRAASKAEALEGLERWKARHPKAADALEPADVLVDGMRGRSSLWYRVRVNLTHVPEERATCAGGARPGLRPLGGLRVARPGRPTGTCPTEEEGDRVTPGPNGGYWLTGTRLIRIALALPLIIGLLLGTSIASVAARSTATGLDAGNRGWFFLMVPPIQLVTSVGATAYLAYLYFGLAALPPKAGRSALAVCSVMTRPRTLDGLGRSAEAITALGLAVGGTVAVILAVPVQVMLTTWLITRPDL